MGVPTERSLDKNAEFASAIKRGVVNAIIPVIITGIFSFAALPYVVKDLVKNVDELTENVRKVSSEVRLLREDFTIYKNRVEDKTARLETVTERTERLAQELRERILIQETLRLGK